MWAFLVASWPGVLKVQGIDGRVEAPASAELVDAGEWAAARGTGELAETLGSIEQPKRYNDKAQSNDKEQRTLNSLFPCNAQKTRDNFWTLHVL